MSQRKTATTTTISDHGLVLDWTDRGLHVTWTDDCDLSDDERRQICEQLVAEWPAIVSGALGKLQHPAWCDPARCFADDENPDDGHCSRHVVARRADGGELTAYVEAWQGGGQPRLVIDGSMLSGIDLDQAALFCRGLVELLEQVS